jgi:TRAP-type transport system small permease protein
VFLSESLMLMINIMFLLGTWRMHELQVTNVSPVAGLSMIWVYGIGYVVSVVMGLFNLHKLWRLFTGQLTEAEMVQVVEAEGLKEAEATIAKN